MNSKKITATVVIASLKRVSKPNMYTLWLIIKFLFWTTALVAFLYCLLTHLILWVELRLLSIKEEKPLDPSISLFLKSFIIEFACTMVNIILYPFKFWSAKKLLPRDFSSPPNIPVLFVHGYLHNQIAWLWFMRQMRHRSEIGQLYSLNLFPPFASIAELAELVKDKVNDIQAETGSSRVILIGHSMGGIVCSYFSEYLARPNEIAKVITLGSPFRGTRMAAFGIGQNAKEMLPKSAFLNELNERIQQSDVPYFSIVSKIDNIVIPWQSALLMNESPTKVNYILNDHGHLRLLISSSVIQQTCRWIAS